MPLAFSARGKLQERGYPCRLVQIQPGRSFLSCDTIIVLAVLSFINRPSAAHTDNKRRSGTTYWISSCINVIALPHPCCPRRSCVIVGRGRLIGGHSRAGYFCGCDSVYLRPAASVPRGACTPPSERSEQAHRGRGESHIGTTPTRARFPRREQELAWFGSDGCGRHSPNFRCLRLGRPTSSRPCLVHSRQDIPWLPERSPLADPTGKPALETPVACRGGTMSVGPHTGLAPLAGRTLSKKRQAIRLGTPYLTARYPCRLTDRCFGGP